jgi:uroporphyrinogen-III synthase
LRVAITRPVERALETEELIRKMGWEPIVIPTIDIVSRPIDPSIKLKDYDWLVVSSAYGADVLWKHFGDALKKINIAVVGPKTKAAFEKRGVTPSVVAKEFVGEGLARDLKGLVRGKKVLVARSAIARKELVDILSKVSKVREIHIYDTIEVRDKSAIKRFKKLLLARKIDAIIFTSSQSTKNLLSFIESEGIERLKEIIVCAIGPVTANTIEEHGIKPNCMPAEHTIDAALEEIKKKALTSQWI